MEKLKEYLKENLTNDNLKEMARSVNSYNGGLDYLDYYENGEDFFETFFHGKLDELARAICYGNYNYNDYYVRFNACGNLESCDEWEYEQELENYKDDIIDAYLEYLDEFNYDDAYKTIKNIMEEMEEESEAE